MEFARREPQILRLYATRTRLRQLPLGWGLPEITITVKKPRSCQRAKKPSPRRWSCAVCRVDAASQRELQQHRAGKEHRVKSDAAAVEARIKAIRGLKAVKAKKRRLQYKPVDQENEANIEQKRTEFNDPTPKRTSAGAKRKLTAPNSPVKKQKPVRKWSCTVCQINPGSRRQLMEHLACKRHRSKVEELQTSRSSTGTCTLCQVKSASESDYYNHLGGRRHREKVQARRAELSRFYCAVCDLQCSSEIMLVSHLGGRRHRETLMGRH